MGFLKDLRKLSKQAKEMEKDFDPAAQMRQASAAMEATTEMMAQQTAAMQLAETGEPATAQVAGARDTGAMANMQPIMEIDLMVFREGQPPYPATLRQIVPLAQVALLTPGTQLSVMVDPSDPSNILIEWGSA
jgi:hypothetical protein